MNHSQFEHINELEENGKLLGSITYKPSRAILAVMIVGCACIILFRNTFGLVFGGFLLILSSFVFFKVKDHKVMDVYDDALILFDNHDETRVLRLTLDEIVEWNVNRDENYLITLKLKDGEQLGAQTFQVNEVHSLLKKVLPRKSTDEIVRKKVYSTKSAGFSLLNKRKDK